MDNVGINKTFMKHKDGKNTSLIWWRNLQIFWYIVERWLSTKNNTYKDKL